MESVGTFHNNVHTVTTITVILKGYWRKNSTMPKKGYKSFTIPAYIYDQLVNHYDKNRIELGSRGINSATSFVLSLIGESFVIKPQIEEHTP